MAAPTRRAETVLGPSRDGSGPGTVKVSTATTSAGASTASGLVLVSSNGTEVVIWARNDGKLYGGTRTNFATPEASGSALW